MVETNQSNSTDQGIISAQQNIEDSKCQNEKISKLLNLEFFHIDKNIIIILIKIFWVCLLFLCIIPFLSGFLHLTYPIVMFPSPVPFIFRIFHEIYYNQIITYIRILLVFLSLIYVIILSLIFLILWAIHIVFESLGPFLSWLPGVLIPGYNDVEEEGIFDLYDAIIFDGNFFEIFNYFPNSSEKPKITNTGSMMKEKLCKNIVKEVGGINNLIQTSGNGLKNMVQNLENTEFKFVNKSLDKESDKNEKDSLLYHISSYKEKSVKGIQFASTELRKTLEIISKMMEEKQAEATETAEKQIEENS